MILARRGFTLIELVIVMSIIAIMSLGLYAPYNHYGNIAKVRVSVGKIDQIIGESKMYASNGYLFPGTDKNADIVVKFQKNSSVLTMYASRTGNSSFIESPSFTLIKTVKLEDSVQILALPSDTVFISLLAPRADMHFYSPA